MRGRLWHEWCVSETFRLVVQYTGLLIPLIEIVGEYVVLGERHIWNGADDRFFKSELRCDHCNRDAFPSEIFRLCSCYRATDQHLSSIYTLSTGPTSWSVEFDSHCKAWLTGLLVNAGQNLSDWYSLGTKETGLVGLMVISNGLAVAYHDGEEFIVPRAYTGYFAGRKKTTKTVVSFSCNHARSRNVMVAIYHDGVKRTEFVCECNFSLAQARPFVQLRRYPHYHQIPSARLLEPPNLRRTNLAPPVAPELEPRRTAPSSICAIA
jgi:hypothetical protein